MKNILILYLPVFHQGYFELFGKLRGEIDKVYLFGGDIINELMSPYKEIRALSPNNARMILDKCQIFSETFILTHSLAEQIGLYNMEIIMVNDAMSRKFAKKYLSSEIEIKWEKVFLRWDEDSVLSADAASYSAEISLDDFDKKIIRKAFAESELSSDWWRRIGVVLASKGEILLQSHNEHVPTEQSPYIVGDPRDFVAAGTNPELCSAIHGEPRIIAEAARRGISTDGCDVYMTTFPCPPCAKILAAAGIKRIFFVQGNAYLDAEEVLDAAGVKSIRVKIS